MAQPDDRRMTLTKHDIEAIVAAMKCGTCAFTPDEASTLKKFASSVNRTERFASWLIIAGIVTSVLTGIWAAVKYYLVNVILKGGAPHG